jgi:hypothetical protein
MKLSKLFELNRIGKENRFWARLALVIEIPLLAFSYFTDYFAIYWILIIFFIIAIAVINVIYKKKIWEELLLAFIPLLSLFSNYQNYYDIFSQAVIIFIISFSAWCIYQGFLFFDIIWKNDYFNIQKNWKLVRVDYYIKKHMKTDFILLILSSFLHSFFALLEFFVHGITLEFVHQFSIFSLSFLLIVFFGYKLSKTMKWHISKAQKAEKIKKLVSRTFFLTFVIFFVFDSLLELYRIRENNFVVTNWNAYRFFLNFYFIYIAFNQPIGLKKMQDKYFKRNQNLK